MADISKITLPSGDVYNFKDELARQAIPYGECDSTSTSTAFTATVDGITALQDGTLMLLKNGVVTSESGFTININGLGAKPVYSNMAAATRDTTLFNVNYTMLFIYDSTRVSGGCWICYRGYDSNTNTIGYQIRNAYFTMPVIHQLGRYRLCFTSMGGKYLVPANETTSTGVDTAKSPTTQPINPFGAIYYYAYTSIIAENKSPAENRMWRQYPLYIGYSFSTGSAATLIVDDPVYLMCTPQSDGSAIINQSTPYVQSLPTTNNGSIYIFLGNAYSATQIELQLYHPVYWHDGTGIRLWNGSATSEIDIDTALNSTSTNPVTNAAITTALSNKIESSDLATVATTGSYSDLIDEPSIAAGTGNNAIVVGAIDQNVANGNYSIASGLCTQTHKSGSIAFGLGAISNGATNIAGGQYVINEGRASVAIGNSIATTGNYSVNVGHGSSIPISITGSAGATSYTYTTSATIPAEFYTRKMTLALKDNPYTLVNVSSIDTANGIITVESTISETAISNINAYLIINNAAINADCLVVGDTLQTARTGQAIVGTANKIDSDARFIVGNGSVSTSSSNAFVVRDDGGAWVAGTLKVGGNDYSDGTIVATINDIPNLSDYAKAADLAAVATSGSYNDLIDSPLIAAGTGTRSIVANRIDRNVATGTNSIAVGNGTTVTGNTSVAFGAGNQCSGALSIVGGQFATNSGNANITVGNTIKTTGNYSANVGHGSSKVIYITGDANATTYTYTGDISWSEELFAREMVLIGAAYPFPIVNVTSIDTTNKTITLESTFSETALSNYQVTFSVVSANIHQDCLTVGNTLQTGREEQAIVGAVNKIDTDARFIVGNGDKTTGPSNAFVVRDDGGAWVAGTLKVGGNDYSDGTAVATVDDIPEISVTATYSSGTPIGTITINGVTTTLYLPIFDGSVS